MNAVPFMRTDFDKDPKVVIWEMTRACALRCVHCRAEAIDRRDPEELSTAEAFDLLDEIRRFDGKVLMVLTGGDPMERADLFDIVEYGVSLGLEMAVTPSATPRIRREDLVRLREAGLSRLALSLDGSHAGIHDAFRGVSGSFDRTLQLMRWTKESGLPLQINTTISRHNLDDVDRLAGLLGLFSIELWSVFLLVPTGRASLRQMPSADAVEQVLKRLAELTRILPFRIKSTEAPQFRRVLLQQARLAGEKEASPARPIFPVNDGKGFVFISHKGDILPSGFLPLPAGNVRERSLVDVYRHSDVFTALRDGSKLKGKCGVCEYRPLCGGSRARSYAVWGDPMESDPYCAYLPPAYVQKGAVHEPR